MTAAYAIEHHVRTKVRGQLDYDDGLVPGEIVASVMHLRQVTHKQEHDSVPPCAGATARRSGSCTARCIARSAIRSRAWRSAPC